MKLRTLKLTLAYDGSTFHGWQVQPGKATIQGTLASVIASLTGEKLLPQASGRTDAGVHALAQVVTIETGSSIPTANFQIVLNDRLPAAIRVFAVEEMSEGFHARHSARAKRYHYRIWRAAILPPFLARYVTHYPYPLNETAMQQAARLVIGEHDFTSFAAVDLDRSRRLADASNVFQHTTNVRAIFESRVERNGEELVYIVRGNGFLHHMVRNLVGTFLRVGKGSIRPSDIPGILRAGDRRAAGPTAPSDGLYLVDVEY